MPLLGEGVTQARMQDPGSNVELVPAPEPITAPNNVPRLEPETGASATTPFGSNNLFSPPPDSTPPLVVPSPGTARPAPAAPPARPAGAPPVGDGELPGTFPSMPGLNMTDVGPDRNDPFPNRSFADIVTAVDEAPTGRFMVGVAASSFQGLFGNFTVYEKNFDIWNFPRSFNDIFNGTAFRGGGQEFRIDIQPGTNINRFQVSLHEHLRRYGPARRGHQLLRLQDSGSGAVPGGCWRVVPGLASSQHTVRQPEQPVHGHQGSVRRVLIRAGLGHIHLVQVRRRGANVLHYRQPPGRDRKAVLHPAEPLRYRDPGDSGVRKLLRRQLR